MKVLGKSFFAICLLFLSTAAIAQVSFGPRAGINLATWSIDGGLSEDIGSPDNRLSLLFGAVAEIRLSENFAIQPEINFIQKGFKVEESYTDPVAGKVTEKLEIFTNNIEIPVMIKGGTSFGPGRFDVLVGPSFAYGLNAKAKYTLTENGNTESESNDLDYKDDGFSRSELSLQFGAAFGLNLGGANLFVDARYILGLTNLLSDPEDGESAKNRGVALTAGVLFPI